MTSTRYIVVSLVALMFTLYTWLGGGFVASWLSPWAGWLALLIAEAALLLPEQRQNESLFDARRRVWRAVVRDPLTWLAAALSLYLLIQWFNACTFAVWDAEDRLWHIVSPAFDWLRHPQTAMLTATPPEAGTVSRFLPAPFAWLPSSLRADEAWNVLDWFPPILVALLAMRHATLRRTKRMLLTYICLMTAVLAVAGIIQYAVDGTFLYWGRKAGAFFFATFGYPNHAASFFPAVMALSVGMLLWSLEHREHARVPPIAYAVTIVLTAVSGFLSESRAGMLLTLGVAACSMVYVIIRYCGSWPAKLRLAIPALCLTLALCLGGTFAFRLYATSANDARRQAIATAQTAEEKTAAEAMPSYAPLPMVDPVIAEIGGTDWAAFFENPMLMRSGYQGILALRQHADRPWYGTGAWSFRWLNVTYIDRDNPEERQWLRNRMGVGQANVHNDTLQYLAEHGWIGFGLMLGCVAALFLPFLKFLFTSPAYTFTDEQADRCWLNRINVTAVFILMATTMMAFHSFIDLVFRSPACMMLYGLLFVCAPGCLVYVGKRGSAAPAAPAVRSGP